MCFFRWNQLVSDIHRQHNRLNQDQYDASQRPNN